MISKVLYNTNILPFYYKLGLEISGGFSDCHAGQFVMLRVSGQLDPLLRRPFGIYKNWGRGQGSRVKGIEILYKVVGKGTAIMSGLKKGDEVDVLGPLGNSFPAAGEYKNIIMVAGGIGIVPFYVLGSRAGTHPKDGCGFKGSRVRLLFGGRNRYDLPGLDDFKKLGIDLKISTDDGSAGEKGLVTELLKEELKTQNSQLKTVVYACGPKPMLKAVAEIADKGNIPCYVSLDNVMACGMGACLGCAIKAKGSRAGTHPKDGWGFKGSRGIETSHNSQLYKMVCKDGPVFDAKEIDWEAI